MGLVPILTSDGFKILTSDGFVIYIWEDDDICAPVVQNDDGGICIPPTPSTDRQ